MKRKIIYLIVISLLLLILAACDPLTGPLSISERINAFSATLNQSDRSNVQDHFHPNMTQYNQLADPTSFNSIFPTSDQPFSITEVSRSDHAGGGKDVVCNLTSKNGTFNLSLWMLQYGDDWRIRELNYNSGSFTLN